MPDGYVCLRIDFARRRPFTGHLDVWSERETQDLYHASNGPARSPGSSRKVGINGISYYAMNQWPVGALRPPHLTALCIWEGFPTTIANLPPRRHPLQFINSWYARQVPSVQYGVGDQGNSSGVTGEYVAGPETLPQEELAKTSPTPVRAERRRLFDDYYSKRMAKFEKIEAPLLSAGNWGGRVCIRAEISKAVCGPARSRNGWRCTATRTSPISTAITAGAAEKILRPLPERRKHRLGRPAAGVAEHPPSRREICAAGGERMAARAHAMDKIFPAAGRASSAPTAVPATTLDYETIGDGLTFSRRR